MKTRENNERKGWKL